MITNRPSIPLLINGIYPLDYLKLKGTTSIPYPSKDSWCSNVRYAALAPDGQTYLSVDRGGISTSEYLEIDLGYVRTINYVTFDIQMAPVSIQVEYDAVSSANRNHSWIPVTPMPTMPFDSEIQFNPQTLHAWYNADMYFTDGKQKPVQTRYLRFTFTRRDPWPGTDVNHPPGLHDTIPPGQFQWPICVRHLRAGLFSIPNPGTSQLGLIEGTGLLFQQEPIGLIPFLPEIDDNIAGGNTGTQVRQRFVIPDSAIRGSGEQAIIPNIRGFGFFVNIPIPTLLGNVDETYLSENVQFGWELWDVTNPANEVRTSVGIEKGALAFGDQWLDVYFNRPPDPGPPPGGQPPPPPKTETHCGEWNFYICANDPTNVMHWYWYDSKAKTASLSSPAGGPPPPISKLGGVLGPINETQPFFPCGLSKAGGTYIPQQYCWPVTVPSDTPHDPAQGPVAPPSSTQHCGFWVHFNLSSQSLTTVIGVCWYDQTADTYSIHPPFGAPPQPSETKLSLPLPGQHPTTPWPHTPQSITYCYNVQDPPSEPPPGPPPSANNKVYELRIWSRNVEVADQFYISEPNNLSARVMPGTCAFTTGSTTVVTSTDLTDKLRVNDWIAVSGVFDTVESGDTPLAYKITALNANTLTLDRPYAEPTNANATTLLVFALYGWDGTQYLADGQQNLVMRLWGDVGASGQDILGNSYRYATKEKQANDVLINSKEGWLSAPMPSQNAVEALYFDVRDVDDVGNYTYRVLDALRITPTTPGVQMSIYYSQSNLTGHPPVSVDDFDYLLWTPVSNNSFTLKKKQTIRFPTQVKAAFMKLEFTSLVPLPYHIPLFPPFPPQIYRRYPTWIELQFDNAGVRSSVQDWWLRNSTPVERLILNELRDPVREFEYEEGLMFAEQILNTPPPNTTVAPLVPPIDTKTAPINATVQKNQASPPLDTTTGRKVWIHGLSNQYSASLLMSVDQDSVLGRTTVARFNPRVFANQAEKLPAPTPASLVPSVSSVSNRVTDAFSMLSNTPMRFNQPSRHVYRQEWGEFNKKAFFVGINSINFMRTDFTVKHDDILIQDVLHDDLMLTENTWFRGADSRIPDGGTVFLTYFVDGQEFIDEQVTLNGELPVTLNGFGPHLVNLLVYSLHQKLGDQYFENDDFTLSISMDEFGKRTYSIARSALVRRLEAPPHPSIYSDHTVVLGLGYALPGNTWDDDDIVLSTGIPFSDYERLGLTDSTYGSNTYGAGTYGDMA